MGNLGQGIYLRLKRGLRGVDRDPPVGRPAIGPWPSRLDLVLHEDDLTENRDGEIANGDPLVPGDEIARDVAVGCQQAEQVFQRAGRRPDDELRAVSLDRRAPGDVVTAGELGRFQRFRCHGR